MSSEATNTSPSNKGTVQPFSEAQLKFIMDHEDNEVPHELIAATLPPPELARDQSDRHSSPSLQKRVSKASSLFSWGSATATPKGSAYPLSDKTTAAEEQQLANIVFEDEVSDEEPQYVATSPKTTTQQLSLEQPIADKSDQTYELDLDTLLERLKKLEKALDNYDQTRLTQQRKDCVAEKARNSERDAFKETTTLSRSQAQLWDSRKGDGVEDYDVYIEKRQTCCKNGTCDWCMPVIDTAIMGKVFIPRIRAEELED